jgi:hypothetical protein
VLLYRADRCGGLDSKNVRELSATYAFVLRPDYRAVDITRTRATFGHPSQKWPVVDSDRFRYIGSRMSIFSYRGKFYFDTFLTSHADFEDRRVNDPALPSTLGVFLREHGVTNQVCELSSAASKTRN